MFISRNRWNQMERRVAALEKICRPDVSPLSQMEETLTEAVYHRLYSTPIYLKLDGKTLAQFSDNIHPVNNFRPEDSDGFRDSLGPNSTHFGTNNRKGRS